MSGGVNLTKSPWLGKSAGDEGTTVVLLNGRVAKLRLNIYIST